jgi:hypothetical protein
MRHKYILYTLALILIIGAGFMVVMRTHDSAKTTVSSEHAKSELVLLRNAPMATISVADQSALDTVVTNGVITDAPAGSESTVKVTHLADNQATGLITYMSNATTASFVAEKNNSGLWKIKSYHYLGKAPDLHMKVSPVQ